MVIVFWRNRWKPHSLNYLKWEKMQRFKEIDYTAGFCTRADATLYLQNLTEVDAEFSR